MQNKNRLTILILLIIFACNNARQNLYLAILPEASYSGEMCTITLPAEKISESTKIKVLIGGTEADIVTASAEKIEFLLPELAAGRKKVEVIEGDKLIGTANVEIYQHPGLKLTLGIQGDSIFILGKKEVNDSPDNTSAFTPETFLAFELRTGNKIITKGIVPFTPQTMEVFPDSKGQIIRADSVVANFAIIVSNEKGMNSLLFFKPDSNNSREKMTLTSQPWKTLNFKN
ncbi:MAG: hypothetical protein QM781_18010 [Chitinophagaceae bacterium]